MRSPTAGLLMDSGSVPGGDEWVRKGRGQSGLVGAGGVELPPSSVSAPTRNRCAAARFRRSRSTVGAEVKCSPHALQASLIPRRSSPPPAAHPTFVAPIYQHKRTSTSYLSTSPTPSSALPYQADPAHRIFRSPIALSSYHPNPTHDSSAP